MTDVVEEPKSPSRHASLVRTAVLLIFKLPKLLGLLKVLKAGKLLVLVGSMLVSIIAYAIAMRSWTFGIGLVGLLFVHELGHVIAARYVGVKASWPIFIPFLGAAIFIKKFDSIRNEAIVGIGGPLLGSLAIIPVALVYFFTGEKVWGGLAYVGFFLNAFNMIPLRPLDGGRVTTICGRWFKFFGFVLLGLFSVLSLQPVMLYVWVLVISDIAFPLWWRTPTAIALTVLMYGLMLMGYSDQGNIADSVDFVFASLMCLTYFWGEQAVANGRPDPFVEIYADTDTVTLEEKLGWAGVWAGTFFGLILLTLLGATWRMGS